MDAKPLQILWGTITGHDDLVREGCEFPPLAAGVPAAHQEAAGLPVPCRGTIQDMGRSVSHKAIIRYKRLVEKKPTIQVAQEISHSAEEVEYCVQTLRRVQLCRDSGMHSNDIAQATGHSKSLVREYLDLIEQFQLPPIANPSEAYSVQTGPASMPNGM